MDEPDMRGLYIARICRRTMKPAAVLLFAAVSFAANAQVYSYVDKKTGYTVFSTLPPARQEKTEAAAQPAVPPQASAIERKAPSSPPRQVARPATPESAAKAIAEREAKVEARRRAAKAAERAQILANAAKNAAQFAVAAPLVKKTVTAPKAYIDGHVAKKATVVHRIAKAKTSAASFPRISRDEQRERDDERRRIVAQELTDEEKALEAAIAMKAEQDIAVYRANVAALRRELASIK